MSTYSLTLRENLNRKLTSSEVDGNFLYIIDLMGGTGSTAGIPDGTPLKDSDGNIIFDPNNKLISNGYTDVLNFNSCFPFMPQELSIGSNLYVGGEWTDEDGNTQEAHKAISWDSDNNRNIFYGDGSQLINISSDTGNITFTGSIITSTGSDPLIIKRQENTSFIINDFEDNNNLKIQGVDSWFRKNGDVIIRYGLITSGEQYIDSYLRDKNGDYRWKSLTQGTYSVVDTFSDMFRSVKYLVSCDVQSGDDHAMTCEITLANSNNNTLEPRISVYGIVSTSGEQFVTFDVRRGDDNTIELIAYTDMDNCYTTLSRQYIIYPND